MFFAAADRIDASPRAQQESSYQFLGRVRGRFWDRVRDLLESWVSRYPPDGYADLVGRLTADDIDFRSAFWELYLHELVLAHGASAQCHPSVPGSSRRPDFLVEGLGEPFYLEAKVLEPGEVEGAKARQRDEIWSGIDQRVRSEDFFLQVEIDAYGRSAVPISSLAESVGSWLRRLDPAMVRAQVDEWGIDGADGMVWEDEASGWELTLRPIPKSRHAESDRLVGLGDRVPWCGGSRSVTLGFVGRF